MKEITPETIRKRNCTTLWILFSILVLSILFSFTLGRYPVLLKELLGILAHRISAIVHIETEVFWSRQMEAAVWNIRLPRVILSVMVGASLAAAGASYQGIFQNPMASPDILGASAGAGFGAALAILLNFSNFSITLSAFAMSLIGVGLVFTVSRHIKGDRVMGLILAGIMISSLFQSGTSFIKLVADPNNKLPQITYWLMGSLSGTQWKNIKLALFPMISGLVPLLLLRWQLNVITMGDKDARSIGVNTHKIRLIVIICSTLVTASAVSVSGMIGWVGLVIPHMLRRIVGSDYRYLMPASILGGGIFLLLVDNVSRNIFTSGMPIGILTAFIGAPFFLWLIAGRGKNYEY